MSPQRKALLALPFGSFALGAAEFVMMGVLPRSAEDLSVSIPTAGHFITAYALGVCVGTLFLVFGRRVPPRTLLVFFAVVILTGNALVAVAPNYAMMVAARFISGLPHGAYAGVAAIVARELAEPGKQAQALALTLTGQTVANMLGVPLGTLLGEALSWRLAFAFLAVWGVVTVVMLLRYVPKMPAIQDAGLLGQFKFLKKPAPWMIIFAVLLGNTGIFCWWSYVSPWLTAEGGFADWALPLMMAVAGLGMVFGGMAGGRLSDRWRTGGAAAVGQAISCIGLVAIALIGGSPIAVGALAFVCAFSMFFVNAPQQLLMVQQGEGGGEMIGSALVQIGFNLGNSFGAAIGGAVLAGAGMNYRLSSAAGIPFTLAAVLLLALFSWRHERSAARKG